MSFFENDNSDGNNAPQHAAMNFDGALNLDAAMNFDPGHIVELSGAQGSQGLDPAHNQADDLGLADDAEQAEDVGHADVAQADGPQGDGPQLPIEFIPVGRYNPAPDKEEAFYYDVAPSGDGRALSVGPFDLTGKQIKEWAAATTPGELNQLVERGQIRKSTAEKVQSHEFKSLVNQLESGKRPTPQMVAQCMPGDLQRVIARKLGW